MRFTFAVDKSADGRQSLAADPSTRKVAMTPWEFSVLAPVPSADSPEHVRQVFIALAVDNALPQKWTDAVRQLVDTDEGWNRTYCIAKDLLPTEEPAA